MLKGALVRVRRAVRCRPDSIPQLLSALLGMKEPMQTIPLIGLILDVILRLKTIQNPISTLISSQTKVSEYSSVIYPISS